MKETCSILINSPVNNKYTIILDFKNTIYNIIMWQIYNNQLYRVNKYN